MTANVSPVGEPEFGACVRREDLRPITHAEALANDEWRARALADPDARPDPIPFPSIRGMDGVSVIDGHAHAYADGASLCSIPEDELVIVRHLFNRGDPRACPTCAAGAARHGERATIRVLDPEFLAAASEVVVIRGGNYDEASRQAMRKRRQRRADGDRELLVERDPQAIREVADLLTDTVAGAEPRDWMEWPQASLVFIAAGKVIRELGLLSSATHVRDAEFFDLPLRRPLAVDAWLRQRGVELPHPPDPSDG